MSEEVKDKEIERLREFIKAIGEYAWSMKMWHGSLYEIAEACSDLLVDDEIYSSKYR